MLFRSPRLAGHGGEVERLDVGAGLGQGAQQVLGVQHPDDIFRLVAIERQAAVPAFERLGDQGARRLFAVSSADA